MYTPKQQEIISLSRTLAPITDTKVITSLNDYILDTITEDAEDAISYNECYYDGHWHTSVVDSHLFIKHVDTLSDHIVIRILMTSAHIELPDWSTHEWQANHTDDELDHAMQIADIEGCYENYDSALTEVAQIWIAPDGSRTVLSLPNANLSAIHADEFGWHGVSLDGSDGTDPDLYSGGFDISDPDTLLLPNTDPAILQCLHSGFGDVIRDGYNRSHYFPDLDSNAAIPSTFVTDDVIHHSAFNAYKCFMHSVGLPGEVLGPVIASDKIAKTLFDWGYKTIYSMYMRRSTTRLISDLFHTIKIARRNGFNAALDTTQIKWIDLLSMIQYCGGNLADPRNYMPTDLDAVHAYWLQRKLNKIRNEERKREKELLLQAERAMLNTPESAEWDRKYHERRHLMLGIVICNDDFEMRPLQDLKDFYSEGEALDHCVFRCGYYKHPDELVLSVRDRRTTKRISTLTYNLRERRIIANLGHHDTVPVREKEINDLFLQHAFVIDMAYRKMLQLDHALTEGTPEEIRAQLAARNYHNAHHNDRVQMRQGNDFIRTNAQAAGIPLYAALA